MPEQAAKNKFEIITLLEVEIGKRESLSEDTCFHKLNSTI